MAGGLVSGVYSGMIIASAEPFAPSGWLACDGSYKQQNQYADLFAAIGHTYGTDPGNGTFKLPSLNGSITPRGASAYFPAGTTGGSNNHSHSFNTSVNANSLSGGAHTHVPLGNFPVSWNDHTHTVNVPTLSASSSNMANAKATGGTLATSTSGHNHNASSPDSATSGGHSHGGPSVSLFQSSGNHNHNTNVSNASVNVFSDSTKYHIVFYMIKT